MTMIYDVIDRFARNIKDYQKEKNQLEYSISFLEVNKRLWYRFRGDWKDEKSTAECLGPLRSTSF